MLYVSLTLPAQPSAAQHNNGLNLTQGEKEEAEHRRESLRPVYLRDAAVKFNMSYLVQ